MLSRLPVDAILNLCTKLPVRCLISLASSCRAIRGLLMSVEGESLWNERAELYHHRHTSDKPECSSAFLRFAKVFSTAQRFESVAAKGFDTFASVLTHIQPLFLEHDMASHIVSEQGGTWPLRRHSACAVLLADSAYAGIKIGIR